MFNNYIGYPMTSLYWSRGRKVNFGDDVAASIRANIAANLKKLMKTARLDGAALARELEIDPSVVWRWEHEKTIPSPENFDKLYELFGCKYEDLVRDPKTTTEPSPQEVLAVLKHIAQSLGYDIAPRKRSVKDS